MSTARAIEMARKMTEEGRLLDVSPALSRLVFRTVRALAKGRPVSQERVNEIAAHLGVERKDADNLLARIAQRDAEGNILGILPGLSLNNHPHGFSVDGVQMSTWCALDTLILPAVLDQTAAIESRSPVSGETIRLKVSPERVEEISPAEAVVSMVIVDPDKGDTSSAQAIWGTFCHHIFFFASRAEAEQWAAGRDDIEILTVEEGFELGKRVSRRLLAHG